VRENPNKKHRKSTEATSRSSDASHRANPIPETIQKIRGYPDRLKIFRIPASSYWWVRATFGERRIKRSTREEDKSKAIAYAKQFYEELLRNNHAVPLATSRSFTRVARSLQDERRQKTLSGERNRRFESDLRRQLESRIEPFFKQYALADINYQILSRFVAEMRRDGIAANTIKSHLVALRQILKHAIKLELLDRMPIFPTVSSRDNPRPWFSESEYNALKDKSKEVAKSGFAWKSERISIEAHYFITFMVNTFLRPSDWYGLKRKHISIQKREGADSILVIRPPTSKTIKTPIVSMPAAVGVYQNLVAFHDEKRLATIADQKQRRDLESVNTGAREKKARRNAAKNGALLSHYDENAYVFLPHIQSRPYAQRIMGEFFDEILRQANLKTTIEGASRTIYSLRHTAIALRLLMGENVDLLFLARNCRTSVTMLDRFYCRHLNALMAPEKIVGMKKRGTLASDKQR
jgi:hypothetical protein